MNENEFQKILEQMRQACKYDDVTVSALPTKRRDMHLVVIRGFYTSKSERDLWYESMVRPLYWNEIARIIHGKPIRVIFIRRSDFVLYSPHLIQSEVFDDLKIPRFCVEHHDCGFDSYYVGWALFIDLIIRYLTERTKYF